MLNMWRDSGSSGPSATAWGAPSRSSQQSAVGQPNQVGVSGSGAIPSQASLLQVAVPPSIQSVGSGTHVNLGQQTASNQQQQIVGSRNNIVNNPQHASSRTAEMSLILAENLAESVLNHQSNGTSNQVPGNSSVTAKQIASSTGPTVCSGLDKSMHRLSMGSTEDVPHQPQ